MPEYKNGDIVKTDKNKYGILYRIVKCHKVTCWIVSLDKDNTLYKNIRYSVLTKF